MGIYEKRFIVFKMVWCCQLVLYEFRNR